MAEPISTESLLEFYAEGEEIIVRVSQCLTEIAQNRQNPKLIDSIYRDIHTLKGTAQLFNRTQIAQIAHVMEASLEPIRRKNISLQAEWIDSLFSCLDIIGRLIKTEKNPEKNLEIQVSDIYLTVSRLIDAATRLFGPDLLIIKNPWPLPEQPSQIGLETPHRADSPANHIPDEPPVILTSQETLQLVQTPNKADPPASGQDSISTIRVQVSLLDRLMNLVGEMVLVRNQVLQYSHNHEDFTLLNLSQKLDLVTSELQEEVMRTRMQPIGSILSNLARFVRELARDLQKQIEISIDGAETELDKTLIEAIKDPLTHIIRNACDHGIEDPETRRKSGKRPTGKISVSSLQESGQVVVEVNDDGRGLDSQKLIAKAVEKKLITPEKAALLSEREIHQLIFTPGFSTALTVSNVSGRGVGMDVVKTNIEKIGGTVDLRSEPKKGTCIRLKIPLTLAIVPALIVRYKTNRFAIPQVKLIELVRVDSSESNHKLELLQGKPVLRLRDHLLPLVSLDEIIDSEPRSNAATADCVNIVVLSTDFGPFGLIVDEILDTADIVVKPLAKFFKKLLLYSGATIMGDGSVSLIFDVLGIATKANLHQARNRKVESSHLGQRSKNQLEFETQEMLSFALRTPGTFTIPLCLVHRLEKFSKTSIEISGNQRIVQYRNTVLPIIDLHQILGLESKIDLEIKQQILDPEMISIIVVQKRNRLYGIEVTEINDILLTNHEIEEPIRRAPGILGNLIIANEVTTVIDVLEVIDLVTGLSPPRKLEAPSAPLARVNSRPLRILFAEDTAFFVKQVTKILTSQGHEVTHAADGEEALKILLSAPPGHFDLILSDIEMPKMNGFQLAENVKKNREFSNIPMIALTTRIRESDLQQGAQSGFQRYLEKLKSEQLMDAIQEVSHE